MNPIRFILFFFTMIVAAIVVFYVSPPATALKDVPAYNNANYSASVQTPAKLSGFIDVTSKWALMVSHRQSSEHLTALTETLGAAICVFDFNQDGWQDIFLVGGSGYSRHYGKEAWWHSLAGNKLLKNVNGTGFEDVTDQMGLGQRHSGMGCGTADLDNDGDADLVLTGVGKNLLFRNDGDQGFTDVTSQSGVLNSHWGTSVQFADFNRDGLLDVYISNFVLYRKGARTFERNRGFASNHKTAFEPSLFDAEANQLYINKGNLKFDEVATSFGVDNKLGRSLSAKWTDLNRDQWPDLIVINSFDSPSQVFLNNQGKSFSRARDTFRALQLSEARSITMADFNGTGADQFFIARAPWHKPVLLQATQNSQQYQFKDAAPQSGLASHLALSQSRWESIAIDLDHDGWTDIYNVNGMLMPDSDSDYVTQSQSNDAFFNLGNGRYQSRPGEDPRVAPHSSRSVVSADLDNDGTLEIIIANNNGQLQVFNYIADSTENDWIGLQIDASGVASDWIGTEVEIHMAPSGRILAKTFNLAQGLFSQGDTRLHFGLGDTDKIDKLKIRLPNQESFEVSDLKVNAYYQISASKKLVSMVRNKTSEPSAFYRTIMTAAQPELPHLFRLGLSQKTFELPALIYTWENSTSTGKKNILASVGKHFDNRLLWFVQQGLNHHDEDIQLAAIDILKEQELESSIAWLIPKITTSSVKITCAIADTLAFFFDEEEAVIYRKQLTVSPLMRALDSNPQEGQICLLNAIAASENKRAVLGVMEIVKSAEPLVRYHAIRALGLIRDARATDTILSALHDNPSPQVSAAALIALARLDYPHINPLLDKLLGLGNEVAPSHGPSFAVNQLEIFKTLFEQNEGVVLGTKPIMDKLDRVFQQLYAAPLTEQTKQLALEVIGLSQRKDLHQLIAHLSVAASEETQLRAEGTKLLLSASNADKRRIEQGLLNTLTFEQLHQIIRYMSEFQFSFSQEFLTFLAQSSVNKGQSLEQTLGLSQLLVQPNASYFVSQVLTLIDNKQALQQLITFALDQGIGPTDMVTSMATEPLQDRVAAYIHWHYSSLPATTSAQDLLRFRLLLNRLLNSEEVSTEEKVSLVALASKADPIVATTILKNFKEYIGTEGLLDIVAHYPQQTMQEQIQAIARQVMLDGNQQPVLRTRAASLLPDGPEKRNYFVNL